MKKVIKDDEHSKVIEYNDCIIKRIKNIDDQDNSLLKEKLNISSEFKCIENLVIPNDYSIQNGVVKEIIYPKVPGICMPDYINQNRSLSLSVLVDYFQKLENLLKQAHDAGIVIPDLASNDNVKYDPITKKVYLIDYDGMQVHDLETFARSSFVFTPVTDAFLHSGKYFQNGLFTKNIDLYSYYTMFIYYCTKMNIPKTPTLNADDLKDYLCDVNMPGYLRKKILTIYDENIDNPYFEESLSKLDDRFELSDFVTGMPRLFIRK